MVGIVHVQQGQGIWDAGPLQPVLPLSASQGREAQNLISYYNLFIQAPLPLDLVKYVEQLIESVQKHLQPVAITHHLLMMQGARLHGGSLERGDACIPPS